MTLNQLASAIAKREGKKSQARIGDIREILKIIVQLEADDCLALDPNGEPEENSPLYVLTEAVNKTLRKVRSKRKPRKGRGK